MELISAGAGNLFPFQLCAVFSNSFGTGNEGLCRAGGRGLDIGEVGIAGLSANLPGGSYLIVIGGAGCPFPVGK